MHQLYVITLFTLLVVCSTISSAYRIHTYPDEHFEAYFPSIHLKRVIPNGEDIALLKYYISSFDQESNGK